MIAPGDGYETYESIGAGTYGCDISVRFILGEQDVDGWSLQ